MSVLLTHLKQRTINVTRENPSDTEYMTFANEALEDLSEVAKKQALDIELVINGTDYEYIILSNGTRLLRYTDSINQATDYLYYDMGYNLIEKDWATENELSELDITVADIDYTLITLDVQTVSGEYTVMKKAATEITYEYTYTTLSGVAYEDSVAESDIEQALAISGSSIELPTDFQEMITVRIKIGSTYYDLSEKGFAQQSDDVLNNMTNEYYVYFISADETKLNLNPSILQDNNSFTIYISYFLQLPLYDLTNDVSNFDNLTVPLENTFKNLINYYCIFKFYESWQDVDKAKYYLNRYETLRAKYEMSTEKKYQSNLPNQQLKEDRYI